MARSSLATLITRVRTLIGDPSGTSEHFSDDAIQDALDRTQTVVRYAPLRSEPTFGANGVALYKDFYAETQDWESDVKLYGPDFATVLTPATADELTGHWSFTNGQSLPVFIVGTYYDVYRASADLLEAWAASLARQYAFSGNGQSFQRQQASQQLLALARSYRSQAKARTVAQIRDDLSAGAWYGDTSEVLSTGFINANYW